MGTVLQQQRRDAEETLIGYEILIQEGLKSIRLDALTETLLCGNHIINQQIFEPLLQARPDMLEVAVLHATNEF